MQHTSNELRTYFLVFLALLVLLVLTVAVAYVDLGLFSPIVAVTIAVAKAVLIMLFFMHLRHSSRITWVFAIIAFLWLAILISITMADYIARG